MTATRMDFVLADPDATVRLAAALAATQPAQAVVLLHGDLGAGKSTLARGWLRALGVEGAIRSPTYTLVEHYPLPAGGKGLHLDLYRIGDARELDFLGLDDAGATLWLVEWPERGRGALPPADLEIDLAVAGTGRNAGLIPLSPAGEAWLGRLSGELRDLPVCGPEEVAPGPG
ncbi:MAG: tRNA (adenosine(37)-N6)-threonylcarbamoyltransferase complex ATPase subunit type 1 TsaE [Luteimonas sp.]